MSRVKLIIENLTGVMPRSEMELAGSIEKQILLDANEDIYKELYFFGDKTNKKIKDINSAIYVENYRIEGENIFAKRFNFFISVYNEEFFKEIVVGALKLKEFSYKKFKFKVVKVEFIELKKIEEDYALFKTMSPLIIKNKEGKFLDIEDENYEELLNYIVNISLENIRGTGLKKRLKFVPMEMKKIVLKEKLREFTAREFFYINAYKGQFLLRGDRDDLRAIYKIGLGYRRSMAAGMIEVI
ncbi:MAG: CRISPR-associated endoribonuclease Cas6 [Sarcina sp.]